MPRFMPKDQLQFKCGISQRSNLAPNLPSELWISQHADDTTLYTSCDYFLSMTYKIVNASLTSLSTLSEDS